MPEHTCECGQVFQFPDAAIGKRARCKSCGRIFVIQAEVSVVDTYDLAPQAEELPVLRSPDSQHFS